MSKFIFSLGIINKNLLLPILLSISNITRIIIFYYLDLFDDNYFYISTYWGEGIGTLIIMILPYIIKYKGKKYQKEQNKSLKTKFKEYIYLIIFYITYQSMVALGNFTGIQFLENNLYASTPYTLMIILITLETFFFLKYKYYIHHIICLIIFCILSISIDVILENYENIKYNEIIYYVIYIVGSTLYIFYAKYMLEKLYYFYWDIVCVPGTIDIIIGSICYLINGFSNKDNFIFKDIDVKMTIIRFFLLLFFVGFCNTLLCVLILDKLTPNHILISFEIVNVFFIVVSDKKNKFFSLIPYIFQIIILLFYLEIFEFNFCGLNENTKKNIEKRIEIEIGGKESFVSEVELGHGYIIKTDNLCKELINSEDNDYKSVNNNE